jgi:hypothetical protein
VVYVTPELLTYIPIRALTGTTLFATSLRDHRATLEASRVGVVLRIHEIDTDMVGLTVVEVPVVKGLVFTELKRTDDTRLSSSHFPDISVLLTEAERAWVAVGSYTLVEAEDTSGPFVTTGVVLKATCALAELKPFDIAVYTGLILAGAEIRSIFATEAATCPIVTVLVIEEADVVRGTRTPV